MCTTNKNATHNKTESRLPAIKKTYIRIVNRPHNRLPVSIGNVRSFHFYCLDVNDSVDTTKNVGSSLSESQTCNESHSAFSCCFVRLLVAAL